MRIYILFSLNWSTEKSPNNLGYIRASTENRASEAIGRGIIGKHHTSHGQTFNCNKNQWLVWGTGGSQLY